jgi:hypothetical protein
MGSFEIVVKGYCLKENSLCHPSIGPNIAIVCFSLCGGALRRHRYLQAKVFFGWRKGFVWGRGIVFGNPAVLF